MAAVGPRKRGRLSQLGRRKHGGSITTMSDSSDRSGCLRTSTDGAVRGAAPVYGAPAGLAVPPGPPSIPFCRLCGVRASKPSRVKRHDNVCSYCIYHHYPSEQRYRASGKNRAKGRRYDTSARGIEMRRLRYSTPERTLRERQRGRRIVRIGHRYVTREATVEEAAAINAHIKRRLSGLKSRLKARAKAEGF